MVAFAQTCQDCCVPRSRLRTALRQRASLTEIKAAYEDEKQYLTWSLLAALLQSDDCIPRAGVLSFLVAKLRPVPVPTNNDTCTLLLDGIVHLLLDGIVHCLQWAVFPQDAAEDDDLFPKEQEFHPLVVFAGDYLFTKLEHYLWCDQMLKNSFENNFGLEFLSSLCQMVAGLPYSHAIRTTIPLTARVQDVSVAIRPLLLEKAEIVLDCEWNSPALIPVLRQFLESPNCTLSLCVRIKGTVTTNLNQQVASLRVSQDCNLASLSIRGSGSDTFSGLFTLAAKLPQLTSFYVSLTNWENQKGSLVHLLNNSSNLQTFRIGCPGMSQQDIGLMLKQLAAHLERNTSITEIELCEIEDHAAGLRSDIAEECVAILETNANIVDFDIRDLFYNTLPGTTKIEFKAKFNFLRPKIARAATDHILDPLSEVISLLLKANRVVDGARHDSNEISDSLQYDILHQLLPAWNPYVGRRGSPPLCLVDLAFYVFVFFVAPCGVLLFLSL